ncbi:peptidoglycan recognition protein family protein [Streptomonospora sp. S1-112]|uniref:Peptidoglycan recognition protein family protein n=1 Tax=Streptomonospora mangrovi TaxID=2883123 RepID=A0A9X3NIW4_9ACTN|nr:peptidoglycan recognition family protein [Streptomonospora mangrovi]MDA0562983.1 peptidoglycan recognition protein family protein [Streptomonospora mangrovi]
MNHPHTPRSGREHRAPVTPFATTRRRALLLGGALAAGALVGTTGGASAASASARPWVYTREHWLARPPVQPAQILRHAPSYIVVHHTASENSTDHSRAHAFDLSRTIQDLHMDTNGWDDTGQQLTISRGGHIMEGRNESLNAIDQGMHVMGAHTASYNDVAVGIENEGTYITEEPTAALWDSLVETCAWLCATYALPVAAITGHRDFNATICPGDRLYAMLPQLREEVGARLAAAGRERLSTRALPAPQRPPYPQVPTLRSAPAPFHHGPALSPDER